MSLGDFDFEASMYLTAGENYLYWLYWFSVVLFTCIIFLNFIIAETSSSYQKVKKTVEALVNKGRASLISEAEDIYFDFLKDELMLPRYLVSRV